MKDNKALQSKGETPAFKELNILGDIYLTTYTRKFQARQNWIKPDIKKVTSFIPGTIREVLVKPGDLVKTEDKLVVLEAMKMLNTIQSPMSGKIKSVMVKEGDRIPKGFVMIELE